MKISRLRESKWGNYRAELRYRTLKFPDGQPHLELESAPAPGEYLIEASLTSIDKVFDVMLARDALSNSQQIGGVSLDVHYLLGARMDRYMSERWPRTLGPVANMINSCGFDRVRILDPHSEVATSLIRNSEAVLPHRAFQQTMNAVMPDVVVIPDLGAVNRASALLAGSKQARTTDLVQATKKREALTGKLEFGELLGAPADFLGKSCLIVDDICDGGATFVNLAGILRGRGAGPVHLFVTHGLMSRGVALPGIERAWTTTSYWPPLWTRLDDSKLVTFPAEDEF